MGHRGRGVGKTAIVPRRSRHIIGAALGEKGNGHGPEIAREENWRNGDQRNGEIIGEKDDSQNEEQDRWKEARHQAAHRKEAAIEIERR
jgi:hypothetical protein